MKSDNFDQVCNHAVAFSNRKNRGLEGVEQFLDRCGWSDSTFGIESVSLGDRQLEYLNTGDAYSTTIGSEDDEVFLTSWGDWYEQAEIEHCEETNTIRCSWCSHFTPNDEEDWHDVICESCSHHVDGGE